ncbi:hypothetical protein E2C01_072996 [Portunus trituberculatus]|uniref:Uncharacterized protein n=1 Tax=Portunus trituberculatus TaxID=210409 RepID=A0A5B7IC65_PORTR|nr:hypothetical protein [Portunus trituberculatus]
MRGACDPAVLVPLIYFNAIFSSHGECEASTEALRQVFTTGHPTPFARVVPGRCAGGRNECLLRFP